MNPNSDPSANTPSQLIPFVLLIILVGGLAVIGYYIYLSVYDIRNAAEERMSRRNIAFSKEGVRVGVRSVGNENYVDKTQRWVVKAWELSGNANDEGEGSNGWVSSLSSCMAGFTDFVCGSGARRQSKAVYHMDGWTERRGTVSGLGKVMGLYGTRTADGGSNSECIATFLLRAAGIGPVTRLRVH